MGLIYFLAIFMVQKTLFLLRDGESPRSLVVTFTPEGTTITPEGTIIAPEGTTITSEGTIITPEGTTITPEGTTITPDGTTFTPEGTPLPMGLHYTLTPGCTGYLGNPNPCSQYLGSTCWQWGRVSTHWWEW